MSGDVVTPQQFAETFSSRIERDTLRAFPDSTCKSDPQPVSHRFQTHPASSPVPPPTPKAPAPVAPRSSTTSPIRLLAAASFPPQALPISAVSHARRPPPALTESPVSPPAPRDYEIPAENSAPPAWPLPSHEIAR